MNFLCCVYVCVCESVFSCVVLYGFQSNDKLLRGPNPCIPPHTHTHHQTTHTHTQTRIQIHAYARAYITYIHATKSYQHESKYTNKIQTYK